MLTKIEMETLEAIKSFCRRENKKTGVKTFDFELNRYTADSMDMEINLWAIEQSAHIISVNTQVYDTPTGFYCIYTILYH